MVEVYRNLRAPAGKRLYSVREKGKVKARVESITLHDVTLVVRMGGRMKAQREGVRNVHAFVKGAESWHPAKGPWVKVTYNPFGPASDFVTVLGGTPVRRAIYARLDQEGLWCILWE